ncbi:MAG: PQQ-binding-like beta-propeller repeat protein, partial [candidate division WOR-3 bacterium]
KWKLQISSWTLGFFDTDGYGTRYIASTEHSLYALSFEPMFEWRAFTGSWIDSSPAIGIDGMIYIGSKDKHVYAITPEGKIKWKFQTGGIVESSPVIGTDGTIYVGSRDGYLYAINPDGTLKWRFKTGGIIDSSPAIGSDGTIYVGSYDNYLYAINSNGSLKWKYETNGKPSSPVIDLDGTVYVGSSDSYLYSINSDGKLKWQIQMGAPILSAPVIDSDGKIYVESSDYCLHIIDRNGKLISKIETEKPVKTIPTDPVFRFLQSLETDWQAEFSPAINHDGTVYIIGNGGYLYAISTNSKGLLNSSWPKLRGTFENRSCMLEKLQLSYTPLDLWPKNGLENVWTNELVWITSKEEKLVYDIYFGTSPNPPLIVKGHKEMRYEINNLKPNTKYYWKIVSKDVNGKEYIGEIWTFTTGELVNLWKVQTDNSISSSPAIGYDGTVYVASRDNHLYAIYPNGKIKWKVMMGYESDFSHWLHGPDWNIYSTPAIDPSGTIYVGNIKNDLYAITIDGKLKWSFKTGCIISMPFRFFTLWNSSPAIGSDGTIYIGSGLGELFALSVDGTLKWKFGAESGIDSSPAIGQDGTIYIGSTDDHLYAINPSGKTIELKWRFKTNGMVISSPAINDKNTIYVGSTDGYLYAIDENGELKWKFKTGGEIYSSPAIDSLGTIYIGCYDGFLYAVRHDGKLKWKFQTGSPIESTPAIGSDGTVYVGSGYELFAISSEGKLKGKFTTGGWIGSSPSIDSNGTIYIGSGNGCLYALRSTSASLANSPWPKFRGNLRNTGRYGDK